MMLSEPTDAMLGFVFILLIQIGFARVIWWEARRSMQDDHDELSQALLKTRKSTRHWQYQAQTWRNTARVSRDTTETLLDLVERQRPSERLPTHTNIHPLYTARSARTGEIA